MVILGIRVRGLGQRADRARDEDEPGRPRGGGGSREVEEGEEGLCDDEGGDEVGGEDGGEV